MIIIKVDCCGRPQTLCGLSIWTSSDAMQAKGLKEVFSVMFRHLKYHHYLYGRRFECKSDHQPLEKKSDAPPRLQRLLLKIQPYAFEIKYIPDKEVALEDGSSRVIPQDKMELKGLDFTTYELTPCMTPIWMSLIHAEQEKDTTMQFLIQQLLQRWPKYCKGVDPSLNKYWTLRDDISIEAGCITYLGRC